MRTRNLTSKDLCRYCRNSGWVVAQTRTERVVEFRNASGRRVSCAAQAATSEQVGTYEVEETAPCPLCEQGYANEFPEKDDAGREWFPFGRDGYWQGRSIDIEPEPDTTPLPLDENRRRWKEMVAGLKLKDVA